MDEGRSLELKPRGVGEILTSAWDVYRRNAGALVTIAAVVAIPLSIVEYLVLDAILVDVERDIIVRGQDVQLTSGFWGAIWAAVATGVIAAIIYHLVTAAMTRAAANAVVGRTPTVGDSYRGALSRLGAVLIAAILIGLGVGIGFVLLVVPGVFLLVRWVASQPAIIVERLGATAGMKRAWDLARGHGWHVLGAVLVASLIAAVATGILTAFSGNNFLVRGLLSGFALTLVLPFSASVYVLIYLDLRVRKENLDASTLSGELARPL